MKNPGRVLEIGAKTEMAAVLKSFTLTSSTITDVFKLKNTGESFFPGRFE